MADDRVEHQARQTGADPLWRALQRLRATGCWLMFGAHPDDEWNGFLAWLGLGLGMRTVYACATRGDSGQNTIGPERGADLGALRAREMELAAAEIGLEVLWLCDAGDTIADFGFSRSAEDTLAHWGAAHLTDCMAEAIRAVRPDAVSPTFLDVPGQHGGHRAITRTLPAAVARAADPAWQGDGRPPWQVTRVYLPAFSGAGGPYYDDQEPPPPATITVALGAVAPVLGASWAQIGEWSRRHHATQGMGRWIEPGPFAWPLHRIGGIAENALATESPAGGLAALAPDAARAAAEAVACWPRRDEVAAALARMLKALPAAPSERLLARKRREAGAVMALACGAALSIEPDNLRPGITARLTVSLASPSEVTMAPRLPAGWAGSAARDGFAVHIPADAAPFDTLRPGWDPLGGNAPVGVRLSWPDGSTAELDPALPVTLAPAGPATVTPSAFPRRRDDPRPAVLRLAGAPPPPSWPVRTLTAADDGWEVVLDVPEGRTTLPSAGQALRPLGPLRLGAARLVEASAALLGLEARIDPAARVGVIAGESDATLGWLEALGIDAASVDDATIAAGDLGRFTTLLVGVFGFGQRPALAAANARLRAWMEAGGSLVTLYHRRSDGWDAARTPPFRLEIGHPSIRWRVTDPAAPVRALAPGHRLLTWPNPIRAADWQGWVRERALYAASGWSPAYLPLLDMADPGEPALRGTLLAASVGRGQHVHVALALHHQWQALVPGAFRLLANLVAPV